MSIDNFDFFWTPETAPEDFDILYKYCKIDVLSEIELDSKLPDLSPYETKVWQLDQKINMRGITADMKVVKKVLAMRENESDRLLAEVDWLTEGIIENTSQRNAVLEFLREEGYDLPNLRATTVDEFLASGTLSGDAERLLQIRKALSKASTAKYNAFDNRCSDDGRVRDILLYHGASTGRWGGVGIQPQNFPRGVIKDAGSAIEEVGRYDARFLKALYGENLGPLFSSILRGMLTASAGKRLFVADWNAIETRVLWWLAGNSAGLGLFREGKDVYTAMASVLFGKPPEEITEEERFLGKAVILGCGYQMGPDKFVDTCLTVYRLKITPERGADAVRAYREYHKPVVDFWYAVDTAAKAAIENPGETYTVGRVKFIVKKDFLNIFLPSGRPIRYHRPSVKWVTTKWGSSVRNVCYYAVNSKTKQWWDERTYGGKITENIVQAVSRDLLADALLRAEAKGYEILMHSHDEIVSEKVEGSVEEFEKIMEHLPKWADGLPLKAKGWSDFRYRK